MTQLALDLGHRPALGADDFLVAPPNRDAVLWIDRWPGWPGPALVVHGPPGCGKTHLAHVWQARSGARLIAAGDVEAGLGEDLAAAVIDDADDVGDEAALFHLYNALAGRGGHLLLTATLPAARWRVALPDLLSRLLAAPAVAIGRPDDALLGGVMIKLFSDRQLRVGDDVVQYLLGRIERSFDAVRRCVAALDAAALSGRRNITVPLARQVLETIDESTGEDETWISA